MIRHHLPQSEGTPLSRVGEARLKAFEYAATIWGDLLSSSVVIAVDASMDPLGAGILAQAGPTTVHRNFSNTRLWPIHGMSKRWPISFLAWIWLLQSVI